MSSRNQRLKKLSGDLIASEISVSYKTGSICEESIMTGQGAHALLLAIWDKQRINHQEQFVALFFNCRGKAIGYGRISTGRIDSTTVDVRLIVSLALHTLATSVIVAHNHPSGILEPSEADIAITKKIKDALNLIEVKLLDHLIISESQYLSMTNEGFI